MTIEEQIEEYNQRDYQGHMPAHDEHTLREVLLRERAADIKAAELSLADFSEADHGTHWSDLHDQEREY